MDIPTLLFLLSNLLGYFLFLEHSHLLLSVLLVFVLSFWPVLLSLNSRIIFNASNECLSSSKFCLGPCPFLYNLSINHLALLMPVLYIYRLAFSFRI